MTYLGMWVTGNSNNYGLWSDADYDAIIDECTTGDLCTDPEAAGLPCTRQSRSFWSRRSSSPCTASATLR